MTVVTFALPQESRGFVRALRDRRRLSPVSPVPHLPVVRGTIGEQQVVVAHTGIGTVSAAATVESLLRRERPTQFISAGFAGGLDPTLALGALVVATNYSSPDLLRACAVHAEAHQLRFGALTTYPTVIESVAGKAHVAHETGALAVDMETRAIADACRQASVPLLSVRSISDPADARLPVPLTHWFDLERQRPRPLALAAFLARHPNRIREFVRFLAGLPVARARLTRFLIAFLENQNTQGGDDRAYQTKRKRTF